MARTIKILIADDDPDAREILAAILAEPGYTVLTAVDGYEAVRLLADHWINLLITDVRMPGINGFELARQAKVMRPQIQVIYFSGFSSNEEKHPGPLYGPILEKPLRMSDVLAEVGRQLRG
jgi:DNA-binding response OmpR family regulator